MMTYLTDDEFNTYSKTNSIAITRNGRTYVVNKNQILLGAKNLDLHTTSDDYEKLKENQNLLEFAQSLDKGIYIHQNYDYDSNTCTTDINRIKDMESFDVPRIIQQHFGMLGKPSIVILFKQVHK